MMLKAKCVHVCSSEFLQSWCVFLMLMVGVFGPHKWTKLLNVPKANLSWRSPKVIILPKNGFIRTNISHFPFDSHAALAGCRDGGCGGCRAAGFALTSCTSEWQDTMMVIIGVRAPCNRCLFNALWFNFLLFPAVRGGPVNLSHFFIMFVHSSVPVNTLCRGRPGDRAENRIYSPSPPLSIWTIKTGGRLMSTAAIKQWKTRPAPPRDEEMKPEQTTAVLQHSS